MTRSVFSRGEFVQQMLMTARNRRFWETCLLLVVLLGAGDVVTGRRPAYGSQFEDQPKIQQLIRDLESEDVDVRFEAAWQLAQLGPEAKEAVPALCEAAIHEFPKGTTYYGGTAMPIDALFHIGSPAAQALNSLIDCDCPCLYCEATHALWRMGPEAIGVADALIQRIREGDEELLRTRTDRYKRDVHCSLRKGDSLMHILAAMGPAVVPKLCSALDDENRTVRRAAAYALMDMGPEVGEALPALLESLRRERERISPDKVVFGFLAAALGNCGPPAKEAVPMLLDWLASYRFSRDTHGFSEVEALDFVVQAVGKISPYDPRMLTLYLSQLNREANGRVGWPSDAYAGSLGVDAILEVARLHDQGVAGTRGELYGLLEHLPLDDHSRREELVVVLTRLLDDAELRPTVVEVLGKMGPSAGAAVPKLEEEVKRCDSQVDRAMLAAVIVRIDPTNDAAADFLGRSLRCDDEETRLETLASLVVISPAPPRMIPALLERLKDPSPIARRRTVAAMDSMGPAAAFAVPALAGHLRRLVKEPYYGWLYADRRGVIQVLRKIGPASVPVLTESLQHDSVQGYATRALGSLGPDAQPAVDALFRFVDRSSQDHDFATALMRIAPEDPRVYALLEEQRRDKEPVVRRNAEQLLGLFISPHKVARDSYGNPRIPPDFSEEESPFQTLQPPGVLPPDGIGPPGGPLGPNR